MSPIGILLWIKATKEIFTTQFFLPARSSIKIANLLKYSFGLHLLECGDVAITSDISWAFLPHFRAKIETSSEAFSNQKPLKETKRVSIKLEAVRFLMAPLLEAGLLHAPLGPCYRLNWLNSFLDLMTSNYSVLVSLSLKWLYNAHTHGSFHIVFSS